MGEDLTHPVALRSLKDSGSNASQPPRLFGAGLLNTSSLDFFVSENEFTTDKKHGPSICRFMPSRLQRKEPRMDANETEGFAFIRVHSRFLFQEARLFQKAGLLDEWTRIYTNETEGFVFISVHLWLIFLIHSPKSSSFS